METRSYLINQELLPFYKKVCKRDEIDCDTSPNDWRRTGLPNF